MFYVWVGELCGPARGVYISSQRRLAGHTGTLYTIFVAAGVVLICGTHVLYGPHSKRV